jgi:YD repeat-containing protein
MYDAVGNRVRTIDARGNTTTMVYNGNRELTDQYYPDGRHHRYEYDLAGNRTLMEDATGVTTSVYDSRNNLLSVTNPDGKTVSYSYDGCGLCAVNRRHTMTDPDGGVYTYSYDEAGRLIAAGRSARPRSPSRTTTWPAGWSAAKPATGPSPASSTTAPTD